MSERFERGGRESLHPENFETPDQHPRPTPEEIDQKVNNYNIKRSQDERLYQEIVDQLNNFAIDRNRHEPSLKEIREKYFRGWEKEDFYELLKRLGETDIITEIDEDENEKKQHLIQEINRKREFIRDSTLELTQIEEAIEKKKQKNEKDTQMLEEIKNFNDEALRIINEKVTFFERDTRFLRLAELLKILLEKFEQETIPPPSTSPGTLPPPEMIPARSEKTEKELKDELAKIDSQLDELSERRQTTRREVGGLDNRLRLFVESRKQRLSLIQNILSVSKPGFLKKDNRADRIRSILMIKD